MTGGPSELEQRVREAAAGTPYVVTTTERGFDVAVELADAQWWGLFNRAGLKREFTHQVRLGEGGSYSITDVSREVEWVAGTPRLAAGGTVRKGRIIERGRETIWAIGDDGRVGAVVDYRFDSAEGRDLVTTAAESLGLTQQRGVEERVGLVFGLVAGVGAVITVVVLLTLALLRVL